MGKQTEINEVQCIYKKRRGKEFKKNIMKQKLERKETCLKKLFKDVRRNLK
jgi:hypothetical protein